jgi:WD40-like Beta Propeller Repeat
MARPQQITSSPTLASSTPRRRRGWLAAVAIAALACNADSDEGFSGGQNASGASQGIATLADAGTDADSSGTTDGELDEPIAIAIEPAHVVIDVENDAVPPALHYVATGTNANGEQIELDGTWSFDRPDLATLTNGSLTATGLAGGTGTVAFASAQGEATTTATVKLTIVDDPQHVDPLVKQAFDDASIPDPALDLLYPYDGTVFPRGLTAPTMMWSGGAAADIYRIHIYGSSYDFTGYSSVPPPSQYRLPVVPHDAWLQLTDSATGPVAIEVQRYDGVNAYLPETQSWTLSTANLRGAIYYWEVNNGDVVRISPGDSAPETFLKKQPGQCVACHSVSRDGSTIVASTAGGYSPWSLFDATSGDALFTTDSASGFQAISPEGEYVVWRQWTDAAFAPSTMVLSLADSNAPLAYLEPPGGTPVHPSWSADGEKIAFGVRSEGNGLDFTQSTLWIADVDVDTPQFSNLHQIVGNDPTRPTLTYPTFSPDSQWIAFMRATQARTRGAAGELWMTKADGSVQFLLDAANGADALPVDQQHLAFEPTFSPVSSGGYFWLVFVSERTYGNLLTDEAVESRHKQLWVTAIDATPTAGEDPSHPAFWLPGQGLDNQNMRGNWALSPCKGLGASCEAGYECCEGFCIYDEEAGENVCGVPQSCSQLDDACESSADCCDETLVCVGGFCSEPFIP